MYVCVTLVLTYRSIKMLLLYTGGKDPLELQLRMKTAQFVEVVWDVSGFDQQNVLMWIVNYRTA